MTNTLANTWLVQIDWDNDGSFTTSGDDISAYVQRVDIQLGTNNPWSLTASVGSCTLTLNNTDRRFSPANAASPLAGKLTPNRPIRVQITDGITTWTAFRGYTRDFSADSGVYGQKHARLDCVDALALLQDATLSLPLQQNIASGTLIKHVVNAALQAPVATGKLTFSANPANNDSCTLNGQAYTFKTSLSGAPNEILIGSSFQATLANLVAAVNTATGSGTIYGTNTAKNTAMSAANNNAASYDSINQNANAVLATTGSTVAVTSSQSSNTAAIGNDGTHQKRPAQTLTATTTGQLTQITFTLSASVGSPTGTMTWQFCADYSGQPGSVLATGTLTPTASATNTIAVGSGPLITAGQVYWLILFSTVNQTGTKYWQWQRSGDGAGNYSGGQLWDNSSDVNNTWGQWGGAANDVSCSFSVTSYLRDKLAEQFQVTTQITITAAQLYLKKTGSPTGTLTLRVETDSGSVSPSGTLADAAATGTLAESSLTTSYAYYAVSFAGSFTLQPGKIYWLVLSTSRANSSTNNVSWGADSTQPPPYPYGTPAGGLQQQTSGAYASDSQTAIFGIGEFSTTLTATLRGAVGNSYTLSESSAGLSASGSTLSGGTDYPTAPAPSIQAGRQTFDVAADQWSSERTNALTAIQQVVNSEQGRFWAARDGTLTFKDRDFVFKQIVAAAALALNGETTDINGAQSQDDLYNVVRVQYTPRSALVSGVVAQSKGNIEVTGLFGTERWNPTLPANGNTLIVKLPFTDPTTGQPMGAKSIITPLLPGTDYTVYDNPAAGAGFNYTNNGVLQISAAINGNDVELSFVNYALGKLYVQTLQVRGIGIVGYNPTIAAQEDAASQSSYQRRVLNLTLPLPSGQAFAQSLAAYLLSRYKAPAYRVKSISFQKQTTVGGVNLYSLELGQTLTLSDAQLGLSAGRYLIIGLRYQRAIGSAGDVTLTVWRLDDVAYGLWDDSTYGLWDSARWGI